MEVCYPIIHQVRYITAAADGTPCGGLVAKNFKKKLLPAVPLKRPCGGDISYKQLSHDLGVLVYRFTSLPENMKEFTIFIETWWEPV